MLADLVGRLPGDQQRVVLQRFVEEKNIREIARELGRTEGTVKQLQFRALASLRAHTRDVRSSPTRASPCRPPIGSWPSCSASPMICAICPARRSGRGSGRISRGGPP